MKPAIVADEMFPEGAGPYMDLEEVCNAFISLATVSNLTFLQAGGSSGLLIDLTANEKAVHADFFNGNQFLKWILLVNINIDCFQILRIYSMMMTCNKTIPMVYLFISTFPLT